MQLQLQQRLRERRGERRDTSVADGRKKEGNAAERETLSAGGYGREPAREREASTVNGCVHCTLFHCPAECASARLFQRHRPRESRESDTYTYPYVRIHVNVTLRVTTYIYIYRLRSCVYAIAYTHARELRVRDGTMRAHAPDCSDECHRSISRGGWNFWPSRGTGEK